MCSNKRLKVKVAMTCSDKKFSVAHGLKKVW
jgi:hypothetical protein